MERGQRNGFYRGFLSLGLLAVASPVFAGSCPPTCFEYLNSPMGAVKNIVSLTLADPPLPLTNYEAGQQQLTVMPAYISVKTAVNQDFEKDGDIGVRWDGEDLNGWAGSVGLGRALSSRWQIHGYFAGVRLDGKLKGGAPGENAPASFQDQPIDSLDGPIQSYTANLSVGYDILGGRKRSWSLPLFVGWFYTRTESETSWISDGRGNAIFPVGSHIEGDVMGTSDISGPSVGFDLAKNFGKVFKFSFFVLYDIPMVNDGSVKVAVKKSNNSTVPAGYTETNSETSEIDPSIGVNLMYQPWGLGLNLSGLISSHYMPELYNGLKMTRFSLTWSFDNFKK